MIRTLSLNLQRLDALLDLLRWYARQPKVRRNLARRPLFVVSDLWPRAKRRIERDAMMSRLHAEIRRGDPLRACELFWKASETLTAEMAQWEGMTT